MLQSRAAAPAPDTQRQGVKLILELTNLCNFSCTHCIRDEEGAKHFLALPVVERVLAEVQAYHSVHHVAFTGGEPTLHPHFEEVLRLVTGYGLRFGFVTNGWQFSRRTLPLLQRFREHIGHLTFSLDGATEQTHDALRRRAGSYRRVMEGVALCRAHGIAVHLNMVVTRSNRSEVEAMAVLASRLGCDGLFYGHCQPTPDAVAADEVLNARERREVETEIAELQRIFQLHILLAGDHYNESRFFQCSQLQMREFNVDYLGRLTACCMLSNYRGGAVDTDVVADLNEVSFFEAHKRLVRQIARINLEKIERLSAGPAQEKDHFICTHCLEHYGKYAQVGRVLSLPVLQFGNAAASLPRSPAAEAVPGAGTRAEPV
jgi:MoaA/NifB/PqqE/SkfB family radical SAM enzyme